MGVELFPHINKAYMSRTVIAYSFLRALCTYDNICATNVFVLCFDCPEMSSII